MRLGFTVVLCFLAAPVAAQQATGPEAYRLSAGFSVLAPIGGEDLLPAGGLPSGRATFSYQLTPLVGLHLGGLHMAPTDLRLWAGVAGLHLNVTRGRFRLSPFVEGGYGVYDAVVDSGGVMVNGVYRPFRRPIAGSAPGGGGGVVADVILGPGLTVRVTGGYWLFPAADTVFGQPMVGLGLRLARKDNVWYWRTGGRDRVGPSVVVVAPEPEADGTVPVGRGELRLRASDVSLVERLEVNGRALTLYRAEGGDRMAVIPPGELMLRSGPNTLAVVAVDGAGNRTEHELVVNGPPPDRMEPTIAVLSPAEGDTVSDVMVRVAGLVADESRIAALRVNGVEATLEPTSPVEAGRLEHAPYEHVTRFRADVPVGAGDAVIEVSAVDTVGNESRLDLPVYRPDRDPPRIAVTEPSPQQVVTTGRARLAGWVIDAGQIADVRVNGMPARLTTIAGQATRGISGIRPGPDSVAQEGPEPPPLAPGETAIRFQVDVNLAVGTNTLTVVATDASGHEAMVEHPVTRTAMIAEVGPIIRIEQPREWSGATRGFVARARESVEVRGTVRDPMGGAVREIRVNNELAAVQPEAGFVRFTGWAPVEMDTREVEIEAWTGDGRYSSEIFAVQPQPPAAPTGSDLFPGQRWAVVIGISDYADPGIRDLEYADDDALAVYEFFTSEAAGGGGIPVENTRLLLNDEATYRNVRTALFSFLERATEQDIVYVYLAGHGAPNPRRADELYILPYDAEVENLPGTALPMGDVTEAIRRLYAHHTVLITDACHSGGVSIGGFATRSGAGNAINQAFLMDLASTQAGLAILTASEAREESQEGSRWGGGHGVFTYYLLEGLRGAADTDPDGIVRWGELADYVRSQVARDTRNGQHPDTGSQSHDRFLPMAIVMGPPER